MANSISTPFPFFAGLDGKALQNGKIYIGDDGLDPVTNPKATFFDDALTEPAAQPVRTLSGYPANTGSAAQLFTDGAYSIAVYTSADVLVFSSLSSGGDAATLQAEIDANAADIAANAVDIAANAASIAAAAVINGDPTFSTDSQTRPPSQADTLDLVQATDRKSGTPVTMTGTAVDFVIPSETQEMTVLFDGVSLSATGSILVRLSTSSAFVASGYSSTGSYFSDTPVITIDTSSTGFIINNAGASTTFTGTMKLTRLSPSSNSWIATYTGRSSGGLAAVCAGSGTITLAGDVDGVRIAASAGSFDNGTGNVRYR
jgi:hypothetical protein